MTKKSKRITLLLKVIFVMALILGEKPFPICRIGGIATAQCNSFEI